MFNALLPLLETATVTLIVAQTDKDSRSLRVTVIPQPIDDKADKEPYRAFNIEATVNELDNPESGFTKFLEAEHKSRKGLEAAISDLKEADATLAQSLKDKANQKRNQAKQANKGVTDTKSEAQEQKTTAPAMQSLFGGDDEDTNS